MLTRQRSLFAPFARFGFALSLCLATSLAACGPDETLPTTTESSSALTASQTFLVSFAGGSIPSNASAIVAAAGGTIVASYANVGIVLVSTTATTFPTKLRADKRVDAVGASKTVSSSIGIVKSQRAPHPVGAVRAPGADPLSSRQWDMDQIHAPLARAIYAGSKSVYVGVLDSGIDITHPDLVGQVDAAASASCIGGVVNTDPSVWANDVIGHGTHVSGNIAGLKNGVGIVGVAPGVTLAAVKLAVDDINDPNFGLVFADAMVCAIDWSIGHHFDLMNASLTIDPFTAPIDDLFCSDEPDRVAIVKMVRKAVNAATKKNIALVASTGNFFLDLATLKDPTGGKCKVLPVDLPGVIGVSSVGYTQRLSFFSDYGKGAVDLAGPGGDQFIPDPNVTDTTASGQVLSSVPPNSLYYQISAQWNGQVQDCSSGTCSTYAYLQGTSQAAPHVTGVAALAISRFGRMPIDKLLTLLSVTAKRLPCPPSPYDPGMTGMPATCTNTDTRPWPTNNFYGAGEVDALAVQLAFRP
jgi:lantibiotic leader peptide-processing serine protease